MADRGDALAAGRAAFQRRAWGSAHDNLAAAAAERDLAVEDVERLGTAAHMAGRHEDAEDALALLHRRLLDDGDVDAAARWAVWLAVTLLLRGQHAQGGGWLGRAQRLLDEADLDCVARGYLLVPVVMEALEARDPRRAHEVCTEISEIARRFDDPALAALALLGRGQSLLALGDVAGGVALLDEVMVAVTADDVTPILTGLAYCAVVISCRAVFDLRRVQEWTAVLQRWCDQQEDLQPYRGQCLVHRSEITQLHGRWGDALVEVERACAHLAAIPGDPVMGMALYQQGELLRLRGDLDAAEDAYRRAGDHGHPVQPGLALLQLAQGRIEDAVTAIAGEVAATKDDVVRRARVLEAHVDVMLAAGDVDAAATTVDELGTVADVFDSGYLSAVAAERRGAVLLASGDPSRALDALRHAAQAWTLLDAPYETARVRALRGTALRALGDRDGARRELTAAARVFDELHATPALERTRAALAALGPRDDAREMHPGGLTRREVEVLRLVATGATNRQVAASLVISEKTVARHLHNMFTKLGIGSRAAATAWAYEHGVV